MNSKLKVVELFAGVGGFRLGLEGWNKKSSSSGYKNKIDSNFEVIWSNQWEPSTKIQHASMVYEKRWGSDNHSNMDIASVEVSEIPDHDLLCGGFPCQDYSVATTLKNSKGLIGKKGVLWWSIHKILVEKEKKPNYLFLENVDRLLISPSGQRGRDFAIILQSLNELGYVVEWRVINAAEYGMPQRRKRIFILAYQKGSNIYKQIQKTTNLNWIEKEGVLASAFPIEIDKAISSFVLSNDVVDISLNFNKGSNKNTFENTGIMIDGEVITLKSKPNYESNFTLLKDVILAEEVKKEYYIDGDDLDKWNYLKGAKCHSKINSEGFEYKYSEGSMVFPDPLDKSSRTIITGEGGKSPSRFKHVINTSNGLRRLTPIELERLNMFPDNHTDFEGITDTKRAFFMGNALVVGVIEKIAISLQKFIYEGV